MIEQIARFVYYLGVHLLYASFVWFGALGLTTLIRASATAKYWIWVAASLNFVVPRTSFPRRLFRGAFCK